jgi:hypothetical protein
MLGTVAHHELDLLRPRTDDAHFSSQDVEELRKLVDTPAPEQPADPRHARILRKLEHRILQCVERHEIREQIFGTVHHRSELVQAERLHALAGTFLPEEDRAFAVEPNGHRRYDAQRQDQEQGDRGDGDVEAALEHEGRARDIPGVVLHNRKIGDVPEPDRRTEHSVCGRDHAKPGIYLLGGKRRRGAR